ncbi:probable E3 ubiquitin-protein ligase BAH1-like 1 isoform X1 [Chenopodium quinoa]|uniref:RING-type E3 ubiquitin transferase n=1 Tax=Chenopodium quinoa TaxID=63459 RepID=A0A803MPB8_CHEQI|nr:probable E3 ubiquitin-protein ligase BAH1-like 1 isoform X1 [Chenopodium quinoa]
MKFCKTYQEYMQNWEREFPGVGFKNLKKILKKCRHDIDSHNSCDDNGDLIPSNCPHQCPVCDGTFFPSLLKEMSDVVGCFNERARKLLDLHLATGFKKYYVWCKGKHNHVSLIQEGQDLVTYAMINAIAVRKILKKYDKVHYSKQGQEFKSRAQRMHVEILQSPWLSELMAFHINLRDKKANARTGPYLFEGCVLKFTDGKPSLTCELFDSVKVDLDLTCSICLDTVFDPVALTCGHIFCYMCACNAASVTIVDGLQATSPKEKCPLCREPGVYEGALHLEELNILLSRRCHEYWEERLQSERLERIKQAKEHWQFQCRAFMGV